MSDPCLTQWSECLESSKTGFSKLAFGRHLRQELPFKKLNITIFSTVLSGIYTLNCIFPDCGEPPVVAGYTATKDGGTTYGETASVVCDGNGWTGTATGISCAAGGTWTVSSGCSQSGGGGINLVCIITKLLKSNANHTGADQPARSRSLVNTFVVRCLDVFCCFFNTSEPL